MQGRCNVSLEGWFFGLTLGWTVLSTVTALWPQPYDPIELLGVLACYTVAWSVAAALGSTVWN